MKSNYWMGHVIGSKIYAMFDNIYICVIVYIIYIITKYYITLRENIWRPKHLSIWIYKWNYESIIAN